MKIVASAMCLSTIYFWMMSFCLTGCGVRQPKEDKVTISCLFSDGIYAYYGNDYEIGSSSKSCEDAYDNWAQEKPYYPPVSPHRI